MIKMTRLLYLTEPMSVSALTPIILHKRRQERLAFGVLQRQKTTSDMPEKLDAVFP